MWLLGGARIIYDPDTWTALDRNRLDGLMTFAPSSLDPRPSGEFNGLVRSASELRPLEPRRPTWLNPTHAPS
jgi:hypothetical protein